MKLSYKEQIYLEIKKAYKEKNAEKIVYYKTALNGVACVSFEQFKSSWAFSSWVNDNISKIEAVEAEFGRFAYLN
jgi:hypothetical protein